MSCLKNWINFHSREETKEQFSCTAKITNAGEVSVSISENKYL
jgi:hypothetical protein